MNIVQMIEKRKEELQEEEDEINERYQFLHQFLLNAHIPNTIEELFNAVQQNKGGFLSVSFSDLILVYLMTNYITLQMKYLKVLTDSLKDLDSYATDYSYMDTLKKISDILFDLNRLMEKYQLKEKEFQLLLGMVCANGEISRFADEQQEDIHSISEKISKIPFPLEEDEKIQKNFSILQGVFDSKEEKRKEVIEQTFYQPLDSILPSMDGKSSFLALHHLLNNGDCTRFLVCFFRLQKLKKTSVISEEDSKKVIIQKQINVKTAFHICENFELENKMNNIQDYANELKRKHSGVEKRKNYIIELEQQINQMKEKNYLSYTERMNTILYDDELKKAYLFFLLSFNEKIYWELRKQQNQVTIYEKIESLFGKYKIPFSFLTESTKEKIVQRITSSSDYLEQLEKLLDFLSKPEFSFLLNSPILNEVILTLNSKTLEQIFHLLRQNYLDSTFLSQNIEVLFSQKDYQENPTQIITQGLFDLVKTNILFLKRELPHASKVKNKNSSLLLLNPEELEFRMKQLKNYPINFEKLTIFDCLENPNLLSIADFLIQIGHSNLLMSNPNLLREKNKHLKLKILLCQELQIPYEEEEGNLCSFLFQDEFSLRGVFISEESLPSYIVSKDKVYKKNK